MQFFRANIVLFFMFNFLLTKPVKTTAQAGLYWYFPNYNAIKFDKYPPRVLTQSSIVSTTSIDCGTITDKRGNLLFYYNGDSIWSRNNKAMPNGNNMIGSRLSSITSVTIPFVNDTNRYFIFQGQELSSAGNINASAYVMHIINMQLNGGLGDVEKKRDTIYVGSSDRIGATQHANGIDYWLITHTQLGNTWKIFKINCLGIDKTNPVISNVGSVYSFSDYFIDYGGIKLSPNGKYLACNFISLGYIEIYQFNSSTGVISNPIKIKRNLPRARTFEFSPNSNFLYVHSDSPLPSLITALDQYEITTFDSSAISNSRTNILEGVNNIYTSGIMQNAIDGRIYISTFKPSLSVIENPNIKGLGCGFKQNFIQLLNNPNNYSFSLPFSVSNLTSQNVQINYSVATDCRTATLTGKTFIKGNNLLFKWEFGDGDSLLQLVTSQGDTTFNTVTHFYPPGVDTFFASLTVTSDTVCGQGSAGKPIVVKPPKPKANFGIATNCNSLLVQFTDSSLLNFNPSISYNWQFGNGQTSSLANNGAIGFTAFGNYTARLIVTSSFSCVESDTLVKSFSLSQNPTASFSVSSIACINNPVLANSATTTNNNDSIKTFFWQNGTSVSSSNNNTSSFNYTTGGNKTIQHWAITSNGCVSDTATQSFFIEAPPQVGFTNTKACVNEPIVFTNISTSSFGNIAQLNWQLGNNTTAVGNVVSNTYSIFGNYTIQLKASTSKGCVDSLSKIITIAPIIANAGNDTAVFANASFQLNGSGGINYSWQPSFLVSNSQIANPSVRLQNNQRFVLTVNNNEQCTATDSVWIKVLKPLSIPNAFSPNNDGINDVWIIKNLSDYSNANLQVFNRYGQVVFSSNNYQNNFNGTINGKPLPVGTYYYVLNISGSNFSLPPFSGSVTLVR